MASGFARATAARRGYVEGIAAGVEGNCEFRVLANQNPETSGSDVSGERRHHWLSCLQRRENSIEVHRRAAEDFVANRSRNRVQHGAATGRDRRLSDAPRTN